MTAVPADPLDLARSWLPRNDDPARPQMTVATASASGMPDARTVLLSEFTDAGFCFHTDGRSRKVAEIAVNPQVALSILWPDGMRQLTIQGMAKPAPAAELARAYAARAPYLRQLAWLNTADFAQRELAERERLWSDFEAENPNETLTPPATWAGYLVVPSRLTFWEANPLTASRRTEYFRSPDGWTISFLAG